MRNLPRSVVPDFDLEGARLFVAQALSGLEGFQSLLASCPEFEDINPAQLHDLIEPHCGYLARALDELNVACAKDACPVRA